MIGSGTKPEPIPLTDEEQARSFRTRKCFITDEMGDLVAAAVVADELSLDEIPFVYELATILAQMQRRIGASLTDVEAAVNIRNLERLEKIASGEEKQKPLRIVMGPLPKPIFEARWKATCQAALNVYRTIHP